MKRNLLALGSAAVLAVYTAGFERTKEAAARFADETEHRRRPPQPAPVSETPKPPVVVAKTTPKKAPASKKKTAASDTTRKPVQQVAVVDSAPAKKDSTPVAAPNPPIVAPPTDSAKAATDSTAKPKWKDGVYSAWGTSRHGDLEASVQIMNGRIVDAWISQCWTRYPCSRIATLPPQVVQRQSENVDTISGVTQSADAFYFGVMQALIKAKP
jgi:uncharacterized protein with FMN-binding domain